MSELRQRQEPIRARSIRRAAQGERCTLRLPGICVDPDTETTVLAHLTDEQFGERQKADDSSGMFCCYACHMAHDQRRTGLDPLALLQLVLRAYQRTVRRLIELKVYPVKLDEPKRSVAGSATAAKRPKSGRKIQSARSIPQRSAWPKGRKIPTRKRTIA